jgi:hypothetical protein
MRGRVGTYLYPRSMIDSPPTVASGRMSAHAEARNRAYACLLLSRAGRLLTLPQGTISTGQVLVHRVYLRADMSVQRVLPVTMACLFLATKLEETPLKLRYLLSAFDRLLKRQAGLDATPMAEQRFQAWSATVKECEGVLLNLLGYELYVDLPHKFILHFLNYLHPTVHAAASTTGDGDEEKSSAASADAQSERALWSSLTQRCWSTLNDSLLSHRVLFQYKPEAIACAAIYLAANILELTLPEEWWGLFDVKTTTLQHCAIDISRLYALLAPSQAPLEYQPTDAEDTAQTNELIRYAPRNRAQLLAERLKQQQQQQQQQQAPSAARNTNAPPAASSSAPMEM